MPINVATYLGLVLALAGAIVAVIMFTPEKRKESFKNNKFLVFVHDLFNFKFLVLEKVLKFLYILSTFACLLIGFLLLFGNYNAGLSFMGYSAPFESSAPVGLALMVLGTVFTRLIYEGIMLTLLLVKNTIQINNKMDKKTQSENDDNKDDGIIL